MVDDPIERHTNELKPTKEDAAEVMRNLQRKGWEVYNEVIPLAGQAGYYCVRTLAQADGTEIRHIHSVRWNRFLDPLVPVTIDCLQRRTLLTFLWRHSNHDFEYFEYGDGDIGLVCYCNAGRGWSEVLRVSDEFDHDLDERCQEIFGELAHSA